jgi:putative Mn2+ efflux pump MntP
MDNFAVAAAAGAAAKKSLASLAVRAALSFAAMSSLCMSAGFCGGVKLQRFIESWGHFAAFILLGYLGGKMLFCALRCGEEEKNSGADITSLKTLLTLAFATNIDVLAAGVSIALYKVYLPAVLGILAACVIFFTSLGFTLGSKLGAKLGQRAELLGGAVLLIIAFKILIEGLAR